MSPTRARSLRAAADAVAAALVAGFAMVVVAAPRRRTRAEGREIVVLDAAYSLAVVRERRLETAVQARDLGGWFTHVWSVHPMVGAGAPAGTVAGPTDVHRLDDRHTVIEAHMLWRERLRGWPLLGFALSQAALVLRLRRLCAERPVVAVRAGDPYYLGLLGLLLARLSRLPLVIRVNGNHDAIYETVGALAYPRLFRRRSVEKRIDRFVLRRADLVFAPNQDNLDFALRNGARVDRTAVVAYGNLIHPAHFTDPDTRPSVRAELGLGDEPLAVSVTRLEPVKHPMDLVAAVDVMRRTAPDIVAVVAGDGSLRDDLAAAIDRLGLAGRVVLAGNRDQPFLAALLADADVVLAPSMGRALVEAALSATPIVAYDADWHAEVIDPGVTGELVALGDARSLGNVAAALLADRERALTLGARARSVALERFDPTALAAVEQAAYERLLDRPAVGRR